MAQKPHKSNNMTDNKFIFKFPMHVVCGRECSIQLIKMKSFGPLKAPLLVSRRGFNDKNIIETCMINIKTI